MMMRSLNRAQPESRSGATAYSMQSRSKRYLKEAPVRLNLLRRVARNGCEERLTGPLRRMLLGVSRGDDLDGQHDDLDGQPQRERVFDDIIVPPLP